MRLWYRITCYTLRFGYGLGIASLHSTSSTFIGDQRFNGKSIANIHKAIERIDGCEHVYGWSWLRCLYTQSIVFSSYRRKNDNKSYSIDAILTWSLIIFTLFCHTYFCIAKGIWIPSSTPLFFQESCWFNFIHWLKHKLVHGHEQSIRNSWNEWHLL